MGKGAVLEGKLKGKRIVSGLGFVVIATGFISSVKLTNENIKNYELITDEHRKSAASGIARGLVGGALLGPVGMIGGALSGKNKDTYMVALEWADGEKSLVELDGIGYKELTRLRYQGGPNG